MTLNEALTKELRPACPRCKGKGKLKDEAYCKICFGYQHLWLPQPELIEMLEYMRLAYQELDDSVRKEYE